MCHLSANYSCSSLWNSCSEFVSLWYFVRTPQTWWIFAWPEHCYHCRLVRVPFPVPNRALTYGMCPMELYPISYFYFPVSHRASCILLSSFYYPLLLFYFFDFSLLSYQFLLLSRLLFIPFTCCLALPSSFSSYVPYFIWSLPCPSLLPLSLIPLPSFMCFYSMLCLLSRSGATGSRPITLNSTQCDCCEDIPGACLTKPLSTVQSRLDLDQFTYIASLVILQSLAEIQLIPIPLPFVIFPEVCFMTLSVCGLYIIGWLMDVELDRIL